jgi:hypothetical protein
LPPIDKPDAVPVKPVPSPANPVDVKTPVDGTYCNLVELTYSVEIDPVVALVNSKYLAVIVDVSSVIVIEADGVAQVGALEPLD